MTAPTVSRVAPSRTAVPTGWASITNFGEEPITLPQGEVLLTSGPLTDDGKLPQDTSAWLKLAD